MVGLGFLAVTHLSFGPVPGTQEVPKSMAPRDLCQGSLDASCPSTV